MKRTGIGSSEQIDCTAVIPQPGLSSTSAVIKSGHLRAAAATASSAEVTTSNDAKPQLRKASSIARAIRDSSSMMRACTEISSQADSASLFRTDQLKSDG